MQFLSDLNHVRVFKNIPVGLEDLFIKIAVAVILLGDFPESVSFFYFVVLFDIPWILLLCFLDFITSHVMHLPCLN